MLALWKYQEQPTKDLPASAGDFLPIIHICLFQKRHFVFELCHGAEHLRCFKLGNQRK